MGSESNTFHCFIYFYMGEKQGIKNKYLEVSQNLVVDLLVEFPCETDFEHRPLLTWLSTDGLSVRTLRA